MPRRFRVSSLGCVTTKESGGRSGKSLLLSQFRIGRSALVGLKRGWSGHFFYLHIRALNSSRARCSRLSSSRLARHDGSVDCISNQAGVPTASPLITYWHVAFFISIWLCSCSINAGYSAMVGSKNCGCGCNGISTPTVNIARSGKQKDFKKIVVITFPHCFLLI